MWTYITRWTMVTLLLVGIAGCAGGPNHGESLQTSDASDAQLPCSFAGFSSAESFPCVSEESLGTAHLVAHTASKNAQKKCSQLSEFAASPVKFEPRWTLEIKSSDADESGCTLLFPSLSEISAPFWPLIEEILLLAVGTDPQEADDFLHLMIGILEQMRAHLAETAQT
jgi:hypothetical protein